MTLLAGNIVGSQCAIIQGARKIESLAAINVSSALLGTIISVILFASFGLHGVAVSLSATAIITVFVSHFFARKIEITPSFTPWYETWIQFRGIAKFGVAIVIGGVSAALSTYVTRILILRDFGLNGVGVYAAAFTLSGLFVQFCCPPWEEISILGCLLFRMTTRKWSR